MTFEFQSLGGKERARALSKKRRSEIARMGAAARAAKYERMRVEATAAG